MELRDGMLGVVIIAVALSVALFGSYFAGVTSYETEVINYKWLADVSGEFDYDQSPQYIDFDPSSNYTGYYSKTTGEYWPEEYVDCVTTTQVNNYKLNIAPTDVSSGTYDMSGISSTVTSTVVMYLDYPGTNGKVYGKNNQDTTILLSELIDLIVDGGEENYLELRSIDNSTDIVNQQGVHCSVNWIIFTPISDWGDSTHLNLCSNSAWDYMMSEGTTPAWAVPKLSAYIDLSKQQVMLYFDNDLKKFAGQYTVSDIRVTFGGSGSSSELSIDFGDSVNYSMGIKPNNLYLDPKYGVWLKDGE